MIVRRIGVISFANIMGLSFAVMGLIIGGLVSIFAMVMPTVGDVSESIGQPLPRLVALMMGVGAVVAAPIMYGIMGWLSGLVSGAFYNVFAKMIGGIQIEVIE